ncbi:MAG TPA: HEAT repeat domain-containing protein [Rhizomicrobium sp.]|nr:HEAT repeat domain-containing protein [Rhizomicrobium sp.]
MTKILVTKQSAKLVEDMCSTVLNASDDEAMGGRRLGTLFRKYFALNDEFRFYVMHRISSAKTKIARRLLVEILKRDPSILVRHEAAFALGCIGKASDLPTVRRALLTDNNSLVRHEAAMALGTMGRPQEIRALKKGLSDPDPMVVQSCRAAITLIKLRHVGT